MGCVSATGVGTATRIGLGPQLVRDLLLRAGRHRLVLLEGGDRRLAGLRDGLFGGLLGSIGHDEAFHAVVEPGYAWPFIGRPRLG